MPGCVLTKAPSMQPGSKNQFQMQCPMEEPCAAKQALQEGVDWQLGKQFDARATLWRGFRYMSGLCMH